VLQQGLGLPQRPLALAQQHRGPLEAAPQLAEGVAVGQGREQREPAGQPVGVLLQPGRPAGHAGGEQQHGRNPAGDPQQHAQPDRAEGQRAGPPRLGLADREQSLLGVLHRLELGDQRVAAGLVLVEQLGPAGRRPLGLDVGDQRLQEVGPLVDQGPDPLHPVHLPRVVADQAAELADGLRQLPPGGLVRGQVAALPGQHVPGHPGLDLDAHMGDLALDLDRVQHRVLGAPVLGQGDPEQHRGQQQRQQRDRHHHQPFGSQRQISPGPARSLLVGCPTSIAHVTEMSEDNTPT
jgi:hypothetical protein